VAAPVAPSGATAVGLRQTGRARPEGDQGVRARAPLEAPATGRVARRSRELRRMPEAAPRQTVQGRDIAALAQAVPPRDIAALAQAVPPRDIAALAQAVPPRDIAALALGLRSRGVLVLIEEPALAQVLAHLRAGGRKHSSPLRSETAAVIHRVEAGTVPGRAGTARRPPGATGPQRVRSRKLKPSPTPDPCRARSAARRRQGATSGLGRREHQGPNTHAARRETYLARDEACHVRRARAARPLPGVLRRGAVTNGRRRPAGAIVAPVHRRGAEVVRRNPALGAALPRFVVS